MSKLDGVSTEELLAEVARRIELRCTCGKWGAYYGIYDGDGFTLRCRGCLRATARCICR